jgi:transposase
MGAYMSNNKKTRTNTAGLHRPLQPMVAGIDIGSTEHWVAGPPKDDGEPNVRVFGTTTPNLHQLVDWLVAQGVGSAAMESTSVYWIPLYELLEARGITPVLVNARQFHNVPGRPKTDCKDCQWLQQLHSYGLLNGSFRPAEAITKLRALQRQLANLVAERGRTIQWMQTALDQMNSQVHRAVSDLDGKTGLAIVRAIVAGERDPVRLAAHRDPHCRKSVDQIARHLTGTWRDEHLFNLASALQFFDFVQTQIASYDARLIQELQALQPPERKNLPVPRHPNPRKERNIQGHGGSQFRTEIWRLAGIDLTRIDAISAGVAQIILTEVGMDLSAFATEGHFVSWLRLCPRTAISGGKPLKKRRNSLGSSRIAGALRMAALAVGRSKTALGAYFRRIARHKGGAVAVFATARKLAVLVYRMLRYGQDYVDQGEAAYEAKFQAQRLAALEKAARNFGFKLVEDPMLGT